MAFFSRPEAVAESSVYSIEREPEDIIFNIYIYHIICKNTYLPIGCIFFCSEMPEWRQLKTVEMDSQWSENCSLANLFMVYMLNMASKFDTITVHNNMIS